MTATSLSASRRWRPRSTDPQHKPDQEGTDE
jgi:hypothetical protein